MRLFKLAAAARPRPTRRIPSPLEALECRRLLAGDPGTIVLDPASSGSVNVTGTDAADVIRAERVGTDDVRFTLNSQSKTFDLDDFGTIALDGLGGNDSITAVGDMSRVVLILDGGAGAGDTLSSNSPMTFMWRGEILRDNARTVATRQADGSLRITGTAGNDTITLTNTTEGQDLRVNASFHGVVVTSEYTGYFAAGGGGNDRFVVGDAFSGSVARAVTLSGEAGNDTFEVARGATVAVLGGADDDLLRALGGNPDDEGLPNITSFQGGTGTDTIELSGQGSLDLNDYPDVENVTGARGTVTGNALNNRIVAAPTDTAGVVIRGGDGFDNLVGGEGPDQLFGDADNDLLRGLGGNDLLDGGDGSDYADGGPGDNTILNAEDGPDPSNPEPNTIVAEQSRVEVTGTDGNDVILVERVGVDDVRITLNATVRTFDMDDVGGDYILNGLAGNDSLTIRGDIRAVTRNFHGDEGTDTLTGTDAYFYDGEIIRDPAGRTVATVGADGVLRIEGTAGNDDIELVNLGDGPLVSVNDSFTGIFGRHDFQGAGAAVRGRGGDDLIEVGERIYGPLTLIGDGGAGESGNDTFRIDSFTFVRASVYGGAGNDRLLALGDNFNAVQLFEGGAGVDTIAAAAQPEIDLSTFPDVENVEGASGTVFGNALDNRITAHRDAGAGVVFRGRGGHDTLIGGPGPDQLFGEEGDDTLIGNDGNDTLDGGPGNNTLIDDDNSTPQFFIDGSGRLIAQGTSGNDTFNVVRTGVDDVRITVNGIARTFDMDDFNTVELRGRAGNDTMSAGSGVADLTMNGEAGADNLTGNELGNLILGGTGNDTLTGNGGADNLEGEEDDDTIFARDGVADVVHGGAGTDRAQLDAADHRTGIEQELA